MFGGFRLVYLRLGDDAPQELGLSQFGLAPQFSAYTLHANFLLQQISVFQILFDCLLRVKQVELEFFLVQLTFEQFYQTKNESQMLTLADCRNR